MAHGGKRPGAGSKRKIAGTRAWLRKICENPQLRAEVEAAIREGIANGDLSDYWKALEHGFGRPPQALDVVVEDRRQRIEFSFDAVADGDGAFDGTSTVSTPLN